MKRFYASILSVVMLALLFSGFDLEENLENAQENVTNQEEYESGEYKYVLLEDDTAQITGCTGSNHRELEIPTSIDGKIVTSIGDCAFARCAAEEILIPDTITSIEDYAFYLCTHLKELTIPDSVTSIGDFAFSGCRSLEIITIPDSMTEIGCNPFAACPSLNWIEFSEDNPILAMIDGVLFNKTNKTLIYYPLSKEDTNYNVPEGIISIGDCAFYECGSLMEITLPHTVSYIGNGAFASCYSLVEIAISDSLISIGDNAFDRCELLTDIVLPETVTSIGSYAFVCCYSLEELTMPNSITYIGEEAFGDLGHGITLIVDRDSYAEQYASDGNILYTYASEWSNVGGTDWLNN